jgi:hypothetical protein
MIEKLRMESKKRKRSEFESNDAVQSTGVNILDD